MSRPGSWHPRYPITYDPIVLAHARALLASTPEGATAYIDADARDTERGDGPEPPHSAHA